jgi:hypothetical protein
MILWQNSLLHAWTHDKYVTFIVAYCEHTFLCAISLITRNTSFIHHAWITKCQWSFSLEITYEWNIF